MMRAPSLRAERYSTSRLPLSPGTQLSRSATSTTLVSSRPLFGRATDTDSSPASMSPHYARTVAGPVVARATMRDIRQLPIDEAIARIVALHALG